MCACSFFPLYPPGPGSLLDASLGAELELPCTPDILILPSDLVAFAKLVTAEKPARPSSGVSNHTAGSGDAPGSADSGGSAAGGGVPPAAGAAGGDGGRGGGWEVLGSVVCVNPGRLAKDKSGGTFAKLQVRVPPHLMASRCCTCLARHSRECL